MKHYTPLVTFGLYLALVGIGASVVGSPRHTLWSVRYLWQLTAHPLALLLPANTGGDALPAEHRSGHVWQARALLADGQLLQAETILQPALVMGDYDAQRLQAEILAARGNVAGAVQQWAQVGAVDDILVAARQAGQAGQTDNALYAYRTAYTLAPERTVLPFAQFLRQNTNNVADAETLLRQYIAALPSSPYFVYWLRELGTLYHEQKAWNKALTIYTQLVAVLPDSAPDWVQLGWLYYERNHDAEKAMTQFQQAVTITPQDGDGYYAIGSLLSREKRYQEADPWFAQAVEREPEQQWWWLSRANAMQQAENLALATQLYAAAQQRFPDFAQAQYEAAGIYKIMGEQQAAVAAIDKLQALVEQMPPAQSADRLRYYLRSGQIYEWAGRLKEAVAIYEKAQKLDPEQQEIKANVIRLLGSSSSQK